ncbi:hypothetical protein NLM33_25070 [Bradyrhizobium sp. CCGUVB1N3]|uniref:hypothetical protein n=1 Tax=Bradyrhizobium sp. CCGUVB1N3 TaxID=2949629 RepID=UPI0020B250A7|nr:hypothetical protein [Bradyrhizobium sp. CCGUVB1N3]MCP3471808.1 hypothetical protein [Bradyrhizobium sp. CCGUVB1N3]MCP3473590.1 hypothetical protein [Bradyrhizobium sp. CCGUVB1N3]
MTVALPCTYLEWEIALTRHFLSIGQGDASPLRSFEVTDYTLTEAVGQKHTDRERVIEAFRSTLADKQDALVKALQRGEYRRYSGDEIPGCFAYLALTMLVEGMIDPDASGHAFRPKLASFLKLDRAFPHLPGINRMWLDLDAWLKDRAARGSPFRVLDLPPEDEWRTQIGYSVHMSFPSRKDKQVVQSFLSENRDALSSPLDFLDRFRRVADGSKSSAYLKSAYSDFARSYLAGHRALSDHRFWRLVQAISLGRKTSSTFELLLEMVHDEDDLWSFLVSDLTTGRGLGSHATLAKALVACAAVEGHDLTHAIDLGVVFFHQTGHARWEAMPSLADGPSKVIVGLSPRVAGKIGAKLGVLEQSGDWALTRIVPSGKAHDVISAVIKLPSAGEQIRSVRVFGGVRSAGEWLGRPRVLPNVAADACGLSIAPRGGAADLSVSCGEKSPGTYAIRSERALHGTYVVQSAADATGTSPSWSRSLTFVRDAHVHRSIGEAKGASVPEWSDVVAMQDKVASPPRGWSDIHPALDDLIEAVYAGGGSSGWSEAELVPMLSDILSGEASPWDVLRSLQEAAMIEPILKPGWKGRTWMLRRPTIAPLGPPAAGLVVVDGCVGARLAEDFREAVAAMGGQPFRSGGVARWSPPLLGAASVQPDELAARLRWMVDSPKVAGKAPASFVRTPISHEFYAPASFWSWKRGHFVTARDEDREPVRLVRWKSVADRDHDVYVVSTRGGEARLLSRQAAIAHAHVTRRAAMFSFEAGTLVRSASEGALPAPISSWLRCRNLANAGSSGKRHYAYPAAATDLPRLQSLLPNIVQADAAGSAHDAALAVRRSRDGTRLLWINDSVKAARVLPPVG